MIIFTFELMLNYHFLSFVKIIFRKFCFLTDIVVDMAANYTMCAHCSELADFFPDWDLSRGFLNIHSEA
jgi:hypothetical protein